MRSTVEVPIDNYYKMMDCWNQINRLSEFLLVNYPYTIKNGRFDEEKVCEVVIRLLNR